MRNKKLALVKIFSAIIISSFLVLFLGRILLRPRVFKKSRVLMGTVVNITVIDRNFKKAEETTRFAFREMERIEGMLSLKNKSSEISKLNSALNLKFLKTNPEVIFLLKESKKISLLSQGAFDISVKPLIDLWKEKLGENVLPSMGDLEKLLPLADYRNIEIDSERNLVRFKKQGMKIDLGGIAKGYAVDRAIKIFKEKGIKHCLVEAGGDLFALGGGINKKDWQIGIKHPRRPGLISEFKCSNKGIATSGDYERRHHLIDPRSGRPENKIVSVTIIAPQAMTADAFSTAVFILGEKKGLELIEKTENIEGLIIVEQEGMLHFFTSSGFKPQKFYKLF